MTITLYDYQERAVEALRALIRRGVKRMALCLPTGAGKTFVAMWMVHAGLTRGRRVYFVADRQTLVDQTSERFSEFGIPHGVLMGNRSRRLWEPVIVCSSQTLESRGFDWDMPSRGIFEQTTPAPDPDFMILDECHEVRRKIVDYAKARGILTLGLSATPFTPGLADIYQEVVNVTTTSALIRSGNLAPLKVVGAKTEVDVAGVRLSGNGEWVKEDLSRRVLQITGDAVEEWTKHTADQFGGPVPTIAFFPTVADAEDAAEKFQEAGHDFRVVHYRMTADEKQETIDRFRRGGHIGLISCVALTKGFDVPATRCMIDAYPLRKSLAMHIQKVGRIMRSAPDKDFGLLIDMSGNWSGFYAATHSFFDTGCDRLSDEKLGKATRQPPEKTADLKCKECGYFWPRPERGDPPVTECPSCGAARKRPRGRIQTVSGKLDLIDEVDGKGRKLPWEGDWWRELCAIASGMTMDDDKAKKIALAKYRQTFGRWPPRGTEFERIDRTPHPKVARYSYNQYRRWKRRQSA